jgi:broad specificity phosphatase PhoE
VVRIATTSLLLIRHAQSEWNALGRWQGHADPALSELGVEQARLGASRLGAFDAIVSSTLERAAHTASIIANDLGVGPVHLDERWIERGVGEWTGLTRADIDEKWPGMLADRRMHDSFEPADAVVARSLEALRHLHLELGDATVLVVTHGGIIRLLEREIGEADGLIPNLGGRWFIVEPTRVRLGESVALLTSNELPAVVPNHL